ncbi:MAG: type II secretion system F family protein [Candidatus Bathyarchaeota archaeon]|nr:MAG: type II secretion system F family protein [Candidatus Bathyarchaeota archaeon]
MTRPQFGRRLRQTSKRVVEKITAKLHLLSSNLSFKTKTASDDGWKPHIFAYRLIGRRSDQLLPIFKDMDKSLRKSGIMIGFRPYVSLTVLASTLSFFFAAALIPPMLHLWLKISPFPSFLFGLGFALLAAALTTILFYIYPLFKADIKGRNLDENLAFTAGYFLIMAGSGVPPDRMFRSLSRIPQKLEAINESRMIVRDMDLFGVDTVTAMENASKRTPSRKFKELLEGLIATIHSGGSLSSYLLQRYRQSMKSKRISLRKFSDTLGVLSEIYVTLLVAGPLIFVVMLAVMAMLGGGGLGAFSPVLLLSLLSYIGIPIGSIIFLIVLDALTPRW